MFLSKEITAIELFIKSERQEAIKRFKKHRKELLKCKEYDRDCYCNHPHCNTLEGRCCEIMDIYSLTDEELK
jgi:hypothetical protein